METSHIATMALSKRHNDEIQELSKRMCTLEAQLAMVAEQQERMVGEIKEHITKEYNKLKLMVAQPLLDIKKEVLESISNPSGLLVDAMRSAVKKPAMKKSRDPVQFPENQRATQEQLHLECCPIPPKLNEMLLELQQQTGPMDRFVVGAGQGEGLKLSYPVWRQICCSVGKALKRIRSADPNCQQPLLWSIGAPDGGENAAHRYVYKREQLTGYLHQVLQEQVTVRVTNKNHLASGSVLRLGEKRRRRVQMTRGQMILRLLREEKALDLPRKDWPLGDLDGRIPFDAPLEQEEDDL